MAIKGIDVRTYELDGMRAFQQIQLRRPLKPQPAAGLRHSPLVKSGLEDGHGREIKLPYAVGDQLWLRYTDRVRMAITPDGRSHYAYPTVTRATSRYWVEVVGMAVGSHGGRSTADLIEMGLAGDYEEAGRRLGFPGPGHEWDNMNAQEQYAWFLANHKAGFVPETVPDDGQLEWIITVKPINKPIEKPELTNG